MNFHSFPNSNVWRSAGAPNQAQGFSTNAQVQSWGARGPSVASDNSGFQAGNKWGNSGGNTDTRSWGGRGTGAPAFADDQAHAGGGNKWGARGPSVVSGNHQSPPAPSWNGGTSWSTPGSDRAWGGAVWGSSHAPHQMPTQSAPQWTPRNSPEVRPAPPPAKPVADWSWANSGAASTNAPKDTASGSANWAAGNPSGTTNGSGAQGAGMGWANGETGSPVGGGSQNAGDDDTTSGSGAQGAGMGWANGETGSPVGGGSQKPGGNGTTNGSDAQGAGMGWANGETGSPVGGGSQNAGDDDTTSDSASGDGGTSDWVNAGSGSENTGAAEEAGESDQTDDATADDGADSDHTDDATTEDSANSDGSDWVDAGENAGESGNDATDSDAGTGEAGDDTGADGGGESGSGETGSGETGSGETGSGGETDTQPVELDSTQQVDNIRFLSGLVGNESPSEAEATRVVEIYNSFRLSPAELTNLQTMAQNAATRMFATEGQDFATHAQNWANYSDEERQGAITAFFEGIRDDLGLETPINFYNTPPTDSGMVSHGHYNPDDNSLSVNVNSEVHETFPEVMTTVFHEIVHASYYQDTADVATDDVPALLENGDLTYAQALTHLNVFPPLYISEEQHGLVNYTLNPHEQLAFTGQYLFDQAIIDAGYDHERVIESGNPLFVNMQQHGFA